MVLEKLALRVCGVIGVFSVLNAGAVAFAASYSVSTSGNDGASGLAGTPWKTLQHASDVMHAGDTVIVEPGEYTGFNITNGGTASARVTFTGKPGAIINRPWVSGGNRYGINGSGKQYITIEGFTIKPHESESDWYTGIRLGGTPGNWSNGNIIQNNTVTMREVGSSTASDRYGIYTSWNDGLLVQGNTVSGTFNSLIYAANSARNYTIRLNHLFNGGGNGIHNNGDLSAGSPGINYNAVIEANTLHNIGFGAGGQVISCDGVQDSKIRNNLIYDAHTKGISLYATNAADGCRRVEVVNNTVVMKNVSTVYTAFRMNEYSGQNIIRNNIFVSESGLKPWTDIEESSAEGTVFDNNVYNGYAAVGGSKRDDWTTTYGFDAHSKKASSLDTVFQNAAGKDFRLSALSIAIDSGTPATAPSTDIDGAPRPKGSGFDIGAYEVQQSGGSDTVPPSVNLSAPTEGVTVSGSIQVAGTASDNVAVSRTDLVVDGQVLASGETPFQFSWNSATVPNGAHTISVRAIDTSGNTGSASATVTVQNGGGGPDGSGGGGGGNGGPQVIIRAPLPGAVFHRTLKIRTRSIDASKVGSVTIAVDGATKKTCRSRRGKTRLDCSASVRRLGLGAHVIDVQATNLSGVSSASSVTATRE